MYRCVFVRVFLYFTEIWTMTMVIRTVVSLSCLSLRVLSGIPNALHRVKPESRPFSCIVLRISPVFKSFGNKPYNHYSRQSKVCWKCGVCVETKELFCKECKSIQKADVGSNYFDLLGVGEKYELDLKNLSNNFRNLQRLLHPDLFINKNEEEKAISADYSSLVNKAYATLSNPLSRGIYMLQLNDVHIEEGTVNVSQEFLKDMMERNEELDDVKDVEEIKRLSEFYRSVLQNLSVETGNAFNEGDLKKAREIILKMKYFSNIEMKMRNLRQKYGVVE